ncbi:MAG: peptidylprolyl isomerase [Terriglobales bacterium]|jgi:peptidyl-prolyl cis-trans isomerase C
MKYRFQIAGLVVLAALAVVTVGAKAQMVASHAPTSASAAASATTASASFPEASKAVKSGADASSLIVTGKAVVKVNGAVLTDRDLLREMLALFPYAKLHGGFPKKEEKEIRQGALQMIVFEELVYQEAVRQKMTIAPARIAREEHNFKGQFASEAEFNQYLATELGGSEAKLRQQIKRSLLIDAMLKQEVDNKSAVTLAEARSFYEKNPKAFERGESFALQTISIIPPDKASAQVLEDSRKKAEGILAQAKATKNYEQFGLLAEKVSEDDYRVDMGDRKLVKSEKLPPEVVKVAQKMKAGEVSGLIQLGTAWTIIRVNAHQPAGKATFAAVKTVLMSDMKKQKYEQLRAGLGKRLRQNAQIQEM